MPTSRRRAWLREELILALAAYFEHGVNASDAVVAELSSRLREMPIEQHLAENPSFRGVASVRYKLANFRSLATSGASGFAHVAVLDAALWTEYAPAIPALMVKAEAIRAEIRELARAPQADRHEIDAALRAGYLEEAEEGGLRARGCISLASAAGSLPTARRSQWPRRPANSSARPAELTSDGVTARAVRALSRCTTSSPSARLCQGAAPSCLISPCSARTATEWCTSGAPGFRSPS